MTVFGYVRVSTLQQATEGESLETQKKQVLGYAESRGLKLSCEDVFIEKGVVEEPSLKPVLRGLDC